MKEGFRQSMNWLHTYSGLLVGWILFMMFSAGTASYFKNEITFWMKPELHLASMAPPPQAEVAQRSIEMLQEKAAQSRRWSITLPTEREPGVHVTWMKPPAPEGEQQGGRGRRGRFDSALLDAATGEPLAAARETRGGDFFYRLHFDLHYMPPIWARWIVGVCAMFMLVAIVTGVVTHRRIFADFFTFRPRKGQRSWMDAHNAVAVLALPYHLMITYTGLVTLMLLYMPWAPQAAYKGNENAFVAEVFPAGGPRNPKPAGIPAPLAPIAPMMEQAAEQWHGAPVGRITVNNPNDAAATVILSRQEGHDMGSVQSAMTFDGVSGKLLNVTGEEHGAAAETRSVLYGLHLGRFASPFMRALFFLSGIAGCVMVATGLLLWAVKERQKYAKVVAHGGHAGWASRLVDGLNVGAIAGLLIAMPSFFWANRLLPAGLAERAAAEINLFFGVWALAAIAGLAWPTRRMWQLQLAAGGLLFALVPVLNALTTTTHLGVSIPAGLWNVAGFDLVCFTFGLALLCCCWWLGRKQAVRARSAPRTAAKASPAASALPEGVQATAQLAGPGAVP